MPASLQKLIEAVLTENGLEHEESYTRRMRRGFEGLLKNLGGSIDGAKAGGRIIEFNDDEVPFIKTILWQIYEGNGIVAKVADERVKISTDDIHNLIQAVIDDAEKQGVSKERLMKFTAYFLNLCSYASLYFIENCRKHIEALALNVYEMPSNMQAEYFIKVEHILKKEVALRVAESALGQADIAEFIEMSKEGYDDDIGIQRYSELDPEIRDDYVRRDKNILERIKQDDGLRQYIENKFGKTAEEIFNYAALNNET